MQIRAYLSQLDSRDERGSLPDEVGSLTQEGRRGLPPSDAEGRERF